MKKFASVRPAVLYVVLCAVGVAAFVYPFWLPASALESQAHAGDAPLLAAVVGLLVVVVLALEIQRDQMNGATVALLGVLSALGGMLRLLDLPGGGSGMFFLIVLAGAALGPRFGLLLGLCAMAVSAVITGGLGPWLPFQMLGLAWMGAGAGVLGLVVRRRRPLTQLLAIAAYGWVWGFLYGAILNLWFWPFSVGTGALQWNPSLGLTESIHHYWAFYVTTSLGWDGAGALANAILILAVGMPLLRALRRVSGRLDPVVNLV